MKVILKKLNALLLFALVSAHVCGQVSQKEMLKEILREKLISNKDLTEEDEGTSILRGGEEYKFSTNNSPTAQEGEPMVVVDPKDPNHLVVSFMTFGGSTLQMPAYVTFDGGATWQLSELDIQAFHNMDPIRRTQSIIGGGDPVMTFDEDGTLYYTWIVLAFSGSSDARWYNYMVRSNDGGLTFEAMPGEGFVFNTGGLNLSTGALTDVGDGVLDRNWMATDHSGGPGNGNTYMTALFYPAESSLQEGPGIILKRRGPKEDDFEDVHTLLIGKEAVQYAQVALDDQGGIHVVYGDIDEGQVVYQRSLDYGETFTPPQVIGPMIFSMRGSKQLHDRENACPSLVIDKQGVLHVAWTYNEQLGTIYYVQSKDNGDTWSALRDLTLECPAEYTGGQMVTLAENQEGHISAFFFALKNKVGEYVHLISRDGGDFFGEFEVLTGAETNFGAYAINNLFQETFFGDYFTSVGAGCDVYSAFSDGRLSQGPKVYLTKIKTCEGVSGNQWILFEDPKFQTQGLAGKRGIYWSFEAETSSLGQLRVVDMHGRVVFMEDVRLAEGVNDGEIALSGLSGGHIVQLEVGQKMYVTKNLIVD